MRTFGRSQIGVKRAAERGSVVGSVCSASVSGASILTESANTDDRARTSNERHPRIVRAGRRCAAEHCRYDSSASPGESVGVGVGGTDFHSVDRHPRCAIVVDASSTCGLLTFGSSVGFGRQHRFSLKWQATLRCVEQSLAEHRAATLYSMPACRLS